MTEMKQRKLRAPDDLWQQVSEAALARGVSVNTFVCDALVVAVAPTSGAGAPSAGGDKQGRFARLVESIGPTAGYPYHPHEMNVKQTIADEQWVRRWKLPFHEADIVAACYAAGAGDPWRGFIDARVREQLNDMLDDVGSRPAVLRARLKQIAGVSG